MSIDVGPSVSVVSPYSDWCVLHRRALSCLFGHEKRNGSEGLKQTIKKANLRFHVTPALDTCSGKPRELLAVEWTWNAQAIVCLYHAVCCFFTAVCMHRRYLISWETCLTGSFECLVDQTSLIEFVLMDSVLNVFVFWSFSVHLKWIYVRLSCRLEVIPCYASLGSAYKVPQLKSLFVMNGKFIERWRVIFVGC